MNAGFSLRTMPSASRPRRQPPRRGLQRDLLLERLLAVGEQRGADLQVVQPEGVLGQRGVQEQQTCRAPR